MRKLIVLNCLMAAVGVAGMAWSVSSSPEFWPMPGYFLTLCAVGTVTAAAHDIQSRSLWLLAAGLNGVSIALLLALLIAAFVLSPGSGLAALPFVVVPLGVNVASLSWFRAGVRG